jgi:hypothetical protein
MTERTETTGTESEKQALLDSQTIDRDTLRAFLVREWPFLDILYPDHVSLSQTALVALLNKIPDYLSITREVVEGSVSYD